MKLVETTIAGGKIRVRYATEDQSEWLDLRFVVEGDHELLHLGELHRAALQHAQAVLGGEIRRLQSLAGHTA